MNTRVLIVDDDHLLRAGLRTVLAAAPTITVVGEAGDGPAGHRLATELRPDVVLMDVQMPGGDGIAATREIVADVPGCRVLILTMFDLDEYVLDGLRAGAVGFVLKTTPAELLISTVLACAAGQTVLSTDIMGRVITPVIDRERVAAPELGELTEREHAVLAAMMRGRSNAEIAAELFVAETTVKSHVAAILLKLGVRDRLQAVVVAFRAGVGRP